MGPAELEVPVATGLVALLDDIATLTRAAAASLDDIGAAAGKASVKAAGVVVDDTCLLYTSPSPRDRTRSRMPSSA